MYQYYLYTHDHYPMRVIMNPKFPGMPIGGSVQRWNGKAWVDDKETYLIDLRLDGNTATEKEVMDRINSELEISSPTPQPAPKQVVPTTESSTTTEPVKGKLSNQVMMPYEKGLSFQFIGWTK